MLLSILIIWPGIRINASIDKKEIPPDLVHWVPWVLYGQEEMFCPTFCNDRNSFQCIWPSCLKIDAEKNTGLFSQEWTVYSEAWIPLPGSIDLWPDDVLVNKIPSTVIRVDDAPSLFLAPGKYSITGCFYWDEIPETIKIPEKTGLISLTLNNRNIHFPVLDSKNHLWLQKRVSQETQEDRTDLTIFRKIIDDIPMKIVNLIQLNISGQAREIRLNDIILDKALVLKLTALLPVRIGQNNEIMVQVRPGKWDIEIVTRFKDPVKEIGPVKGAYGQEIWVFQSYSKLQITEIYGVPSIDPVQTALPQDWKSLPAYLMDKDSVMSFKQVIRGNADPEPDRLNIHKTWWLDFDGRGFTVLDNINGTVSRNWNLTMHPSAALGRVSANGTDQLITMHNGKHGIEIRQGNVNIVAESRLDSASGQIHAAGWDHDFESASGRLNLPPGWKLFSVSGVDSASGTWIGKWTLLDIFIILIIAVGTARLKTRALGFTALITMILIWHEPDSPRYIWLHLLAGFTFLKIMPLGKINTLVKLWTWASIIVLLVISIPFMVHQIRWGVYPQLEYPWQKYSPSISDSLIRENSIQYAEKTMPAHQDSLYQESREQSKPGLYSYKRKQAVFSQDPNANVQTGPGLPGWKWRFADIKWNGPVSKSQEISFQLISPLMNLLLGFVRVLFLVFFIFKFADIMHLWAKADKKNIVSTVLILFFSIISWNIKAGAADFPSADLLKELQGKLMETDDCYNPSCASYSRMELSADLHNLEINIEVHAAKQTAVPLPGGIKSWIPQKVLKNNEEINTIVKDSSGTLWVLVSEGIHQLTLRGLTGSADEINLPMHLKPFYAGVKTQGWEVRGIHKGGSVDNAIQLTRLKKQEKNKENSSTDILPSFLQIERTLSIGIKWEILTRVTRQSPAGTPVILYIPLIQGESVTSQGIHVEKNKALVNLGPQQKTMTWMSALEQTNRLTLQSPDTKSWSETWIIDASPIWHLEFRGIPFIHNQDEQGLWKPEWRPWPGEKVDILITRPEPVKGQTLTIDHAELTWIPGKRTSNASLKLRIRSARGTRHIIELPDRAELGQVKINNIIKPIRQENNIIPVPLMPGVQNIEINWHQDSGISLLEKGPDVKIGSQAVNAKITFKMPENRWILFAKGPAMGPAVLFWPYIFVILLASFILGKIKLTPLKTRHWILLGLGLTQIHVLGAIIIAGWFLAMGTRKITPMPKGWFKFDMIQLCLALLSFGAMICLYLAVKKGLLGRPEMQIMGNGSTNTWLYWTQDRINGNMPQPWVFSLPVITYHFFMLTWALWLAASLIKWLGWGWQCFSCEKPWEKPVFRKK